MQTIGSDRLRREGDKLILSSRHNKGWVPRVERTLTTAEFPGTAVCWDEQYFEVVTAEALPQENAVRYTLVPWREQLTMRTVTNYDEPTESARTAALRSAVVREHKRKSFYLTGILAGHLPGDVQQRIADEYGLLAHNLTLMSTAAIYAGVVVIAIVVSDRVLREEPLPIILVVVGLYFFVESAWRTLWAFVARMPLGTPIGLIVYAIYARASGKPLKVSRKVVTMAPTDDIVRRDMLAMREPLVTLLPVADQQRIAQRFDYQYRRLSAKTAAFILFFAMIGAISAVKSGAILSGLVAGAIAAEQLYRLSAFSRGPASSVLGFLVRPVVRKLL